MQPIQMIDLKKQYLRLKSEIDGAIQEVLHQTAFINGPPVAEFARQLALDQAVKHVVPCANGTDALQIALMAFDFKPGDEVLLPVFTYAAPAEVIALLGLKPVFVDVDPVTFTIDPLEVEKKITAKTVALLPVHLFGQCADMEALRNIAQKYKLVLIEDAAQAIGAVYTFADGTTQQAGTIGNIGTVSFFPTKNLGCFGDGGALLVPTAELAHKAQAIANHGQVVKYQHELVGINSRLDTLQAAVLLAKLPHLVDYTARRQAAAAFYDLALGEVAALRIPRRNARSTHVFHQYTLKIKTGQRDAVRAKLAAKGIPSQIYYPVPLHQQPAYQSYHHQSEIFPVAEELCRQVLSLPMHTELDEEQLTYITTTLRALL